ncbi:hypothetical protein E2562_034294 [Oryza meyeriana var. granulata]|uniref:Uncharacterized protein n=1 Tax=Oryza meyeriana var. granulata TaxID=110450 RepID=A0A6G1DAK1_9ORYZ|nr:hypothetical protein E2562_034294 [Oryza meyeriana var. granulata]
MAPGALSTVDRLLAHQLSPGPWLLLQAARARTRRFPPGRHRLGSLRPPTSVGGQQGPAVSARLYRLERATAPPAQSPWIPPPPAADPTARSYALRPLTRRPSPPRRAGRLRLLCLGRPSQLAPMTLTPPLAPSSPPSDGASGTGGVNLAAEVARAASSSWWKQSSDGELTQKQRGWLQVRGGGHMGNGKLVEEDAWAMTKLW